MIAFMFFSNVYALAVCIFVISLFVHLHVGHDTSV